MTNALIILLAYGFYLMVVGTILVLSWYSEKLDPHSELPESIWDEILPHRSVAHWYQAAQPPQHKASPFMLPLLAKGGPQSLPRKLYQPLTPKLP